MALDATAHAHNVSLAVPVTQNTAPVLEFQCLFTNDIKRKQKRWQDGRLKFHAFNKRVRVFDDRGANVGETHFQGECAFDEGEELELDRSGVLVQVGECVARGEQDLTELLDKRLQEKEKRREARAAAVASPWMTPAQNAGTLSFSGVTPAVGTLQAKPKSLNQLLGTPSGHHGRASLPTKSPFEERRWIAQQLENEHIEARPAKRRKPEPAPSRAGYAQNLTGATLNLSTPTSTAGSRIEAFQSRSIVKHQYAETVDLTSDGIEPADVAAPAILNSTIDSSGIRITKARRVSRATEENKPGKAGYAENLTGASLILSGTYGKSRAISAAKPLPNDNTLLKLSRDLQRSAETVQPALSKKTRRSSEEANEIEEIKTSDQVRAQPEGGRSSGFIKGGEGFVGIGSSPVLEGAISHSTSDNVSHSVSNKRQKASQPESKPTVMKAASKARPSPVAIPEEPPNVPTLLRPNNDRKEDSVAPAVKRLRPLRVKSGAPRCMLISAKRSTSRSSLETTKSRAAEITKSRHSSDQQTPLEATLSRVRKYIDSALPEQEVNQPNGQETTLGVFGEPPSEKTVGSADKSINAEFLKPSRPPRCTGDLQNPGSLVMEQSETPLSPVDGVGRTNYAQLSSSPGFEGVEYEAIDTFLSRNGNASPFAPKALREAIEQSPLQSTRIRERPLNALESGRSLSLLPKLATSSHIEENISTTAAFRTDCPQEPVVTKQNTSSLNENIAVESDKIALGKNRKAPRHDSPKIKESSSALDKSIPPTGKLSETIPSKPKDDKLLAPPYPINLTTIPSSPDLEPSKSSRPLNFVPEKPDHQPLLEIPEDSAQLQLHPQAATKAFSLIPVPVPVSTSIVPAARRGKPIIPNPATRGKKAAQKTDAQGKVPIVGPVFPHPPPLQEQRQGFSRGNQNLGRVGSFGSDTSGNNGFSTSGGIISRGGGSDSNKTGLTRRPPRPGEAALALARAASAAGIGGEGDGKGPWGKTAFDLFDWRPPRLRSNTGAGVLDVDAGVDAAGES